MSNAKPTVLPSCLQSQRDQFAKFGSIRFPDSRAAPSKFVRLPDLSDHSEGQQEAQTEDVVSLLLKTWNLRAPCAMISIPPMSSEAVKRAESGDSEERLISTQLELVIRRGLAEAVAKTDAWVFTSGDGSSPVDKLVGRAMQYGSSEFPGEQFIAIGVTPWEGLSEYKRVRKLKNGMVYRYGATLIAKKKIGIDTTGDGKIDSYGIDTTGDGHIDTVVKGVDTTGDGHIDTIAGVDDMPSSPGSADDDEDKDDIEVIALNSSGAGVGNPGMFKRPAATTKGSFELEDHHSHFVMVEGDGAVPFRERLERHISSNDVSGDQIQTPKMLLVISGDENVFEWVLKALDKDDPSTGTSVPVLVLGDSGGAAHDIWQYWGGDWTNPARKLPEVDGKLRDANYVKVLLAVSRCGGGACQGQRRA